MKSFNKDITYNDAKVTINLILETSFSKEIRILMKEGQVMKEHKTPFPIIVHVLEGTIDFGVQGEVHTLEKGAILTLDGGIPHDLKALKNSTVRLTLSKQDEAKRVEKVAADS